MADRARAEKAQTVYLVLQTSAGVYIASFQASLRVMVNLRTMPGAGTFGVNRPREYVFWIKGVGTQKVKCVVLLVSCLEALFRWPQTNVRPVYGGLRDGVQ